MQEKAKILNFMEANRSSAWKLFNIKKNILKLDMV